MSNLSTNYEIMSKHDLENLPVNTVLSVRFDHGGYTTLDLRDPATLEHPNRAWQSRMSRGFASSKMLSNYPCRVEKIGQTEVKATAA